MIKPTLVLALAVAVGACSSDPPPAVDAEACDHLTTGPFVTVTASISKDQSTSAILADHMSYTTTLPATGIGYLKFDATTAGDYVVFLDRTVPFMAQTSASAAIAVKSSATSSESCAAVKGRYVVTLAAGTSFLGVGPDAGGPVNLVIDHNN